MESDTDEEDNIAVGPADRQVAMKSARQLAATKKRILSVCDLSPLGWRILPPLCELKARIHFAYSRDVAAPLLSFIQLREHDVAALSMQLGTIQHGQIPIANKPAPFPEPQPAHNDFLLNLAAKVEVEGQMSLRMRFREEKQRRLREQALLEAKENELPPQEKQLKQELIWKKKRHEVEERNRRLMEGPAARPSEPFPPPPCDLSGGTERALEMVELLAPGNCGVQPPCEEFLELGVQIAGEYADPVRQLTYGLALEEYALQLLAPYSSQLEKSDGQGDVCTPGNASTFNQLSTEHLQEEQSLQDKVEAFFQRAELEATYGVNEYSPSPRKSLREELLRLTSHFDAGVDGAEGFGEDIQESETEQEDDEDDVEEAYEEDDDIVEAGEEDDSYVMEAGKDDERDEADAVQRFGSKNAQNAKNVSDEQHGDEDPPKSHYSGSHEFQRQDSLNDDSQRRNVDGLHRNQSDYQEPGRRSHVRRTARTSSQTKSLDLALRNVDGKLEANSSVPTSRHVLLMPPLHSRKASQRGSPARPRRNAILDNALNAISMAQHRHARSISSEEPASQLPTQTPSQPSQLVQTQIPDTPPSTVRKRRKSFASSATPTQRRQRRRLESTTSGTPQSTPQLTQTQSFPYGAANAAMEESWSSRSASVDLFGTPLRTPPSKRASHSARRKMGATGADGPTRGGAGHAADPEARTRQGAHGGRSTRRGDLLAASAAGDIAPLLAPSGGRGAVAQTGEGADWGRRLWGAGARVGRVDSEGPGDGADHAELAAVLAAEFEAEEVVEESAGLDTEYGLESGD